MNAPRQPVGDHNPEPDPDEPITRWEVTGCEHCGQLIFRPLRRTSRSRGRPGWRHYDPETDGRS